MGGAGPEGGQGQGMPKKTPCPRPLSRARPGEGWGPAFLRAPSAPSRTLHLLEISEGSPLYFSDLGHNRFHTVKLLNLLLVVFYSLNIQANSQRNTKS